MTTAPARYVRPSFLLCLLLAAMLMLVAAGCTGDDSDDPPATATGTSAEGEGDTGQRTYAGDEPAPAFPDGLTWFNVSQPLTIEDLRGKAVLLDFWTQGCINCQHIIPDLQRLEEEFGDRLAVIGVHSGKYDEEHNDETIRAAINRYGLEHPVVNDEDFLIWDTYGVNAWPTMVLIDPDGRVVGARAGEGVYPALQPILATLFEEYDGELDTTPLPLAPEGESVAGTVLSYPSTVLADAASERLFIADAGHNRIIIAGLDGALQAVIGSGVAGLTDGGYFDAEFHDPQGLTLSADGGTLYVADTRNHVVRAVDLREQQVRTIAGTGQQARSYPALGAPARSTPLSSPWGLVEYNGTLYITMAGTHQIWSMDLVSEEITVFAGTGAEALDEGPRLDATLAQPSGITRIGDVLYWADAEGSAVRQVDLATGQVHNIVGTGLFDFGFRDGTGTEAQLQHDQGIIAGSDGILYVADTYNHAVRRIEPGTGAVTTLAGDGERGWSDAADGDGARFQEPGGIGIAGSTVYVADTANHLIRTVDATSGATGTLTLSNLAVANQGPVPGETLEIALEPQEVMPGAGVLRLRVTSPEGYHLNSLAPSSLELTSSNGAVVEPGEHTLQWSSDEATVEIPIPVNLANGSATLTATGTAYYCREGEEALCLIQNVVTTLPVTVQAGASSGTLELDVSLAPY